MLTEEQEATLRRDALLEDARYLTPRGQWFDADIEQIWALLDASRAETEAVRADAERLKLQVGIAGMERCQEATAALRALAAELVEGLEKIRSGRLNAQPVRYYQAAQDIAEALIARAAAQGITAPKGEKGEPNG